MTSRARASIHVEAELATPSAQVQLVEYRFVEPPTSVLRIEDKIRVELCLNTRHRSAQASFVDYWTSEHYERIGELFVVPPTPDVAAPPAQARTQRSLVCLPAFAPGKALFDYL